MSIPDSSTSRLRQRGSAARLTSPVDRLTIQVKSEFKAELSDSVDAILWEIWDPIGLNDNSDARTEYLSYVPSVVRLLEVGADGYKLGAHLENLERGSMGIQCCADHRKKVASMLLAPYQRMPASPLQATPLSRRT